MTNIDTRILTKILQDRYPADLRLEKDNFGNGHWLHIEMNYIALTADETARCQQIIEAGYDSTPTTP